MSAAIVKANNPAGKLRELLLLAKQQADARPTWEVWKEVGRFPAGKPQDAYQFLAKLTKAVDELESTIKKRFPQQESLLLRYVGDLRYVCSPSNLDTAWQIYKVRITEHLLYSLELADHSLAPLYPDPQFQAEIPAIKQTLTEVMEQVNAAEIPGELKAMLTNRILELLESIEDYQLLAISEIEHAVQANAGAILLNASEIRKDPQSGKWVDPAVKSFETVNRWVRVAYGVVQLAEGLRKFLT